jgi:hypothetical protein
MRSALRLLAAVVVTLGLLAGTAGAAGAQDQSANMDLEFTSPNAAVNSDLAFWGDHAFIGYYRNDRPVGGFRIFDISDPSNPSLVRDFHCDGLQNDPIVWDRNGNGVADLLLLAVDRTMTRPQCGAKRSAHDDPNGWEGVRIFTMSDDPANPFKKIQQVKAVYTDCGAHTITLWQGKAGVGKLIVYVSSYPLRPGPTCGQVNGPRVGRDPLHGVIQILEIPMGDPGSSREILEKPINYPGDPDGKIDWCERSVTGPDQPCPGALEPAAVACHDIVVHMEHNLAGAACAEQGQVWRINNNGIPDTLNPIMVGDDALSSGGTGNIPGAVDFFHSVMFNNEGTVVNWVDESFGSGCPPMTHWRLRSWHPAGVHKTGKMFFSGLGGAFLSEFQVGDLRPDPAESAYCSAHMGMAVMGVEEDLLVNAWYTGGVDVIDFTDPSNLQEIAYYDIAGAGPAGSDNWSAYPYTGPPFTTGGGIPVYASDGVHTPDSARGMVVFRAHLGVIPDMTFDHLNPQTMD